MRGSLGIWAFCVTFGVASAVWAGPQRGPFDGLQSTLRPGTPVIPAEALGPGANLAHADLTYANLDGLDLSDADLRGALLGHASLVGANLSGARLSGAQLDYADLRGANLFETNLRHASLLGADLRFVVFAGTKLTGAVLAQADLRSADLSQMLWNKWTRFEGAVFSPTTVFPADFEPIDAGMVAPEPSATLLLGLGLMGLAVCGRSA